MGNSNCRRRGVLIVADHCTGDSAICPDDELAPSSLECRSSAGVCDVAESCTGASSECPEDTYQPSTYECRSSAGVCDVSEFCSGDSAECPADVFELSTTECRSSAGECDQAETCTGASAYCPADALLPATTECRPAEGPCDVAENCTGVSSICPDDELASSTVECRPVSGLCDVAENCGGDSIECPEDLFVAQDTLCRDSAGFCDEPDYCSGDSPICEQSVKSVDIQCSEDPYNEETQCSNTVCGGDVEKRYQYQYCDGTSQECTENNLVWGDWYIDIDCDDASVCQFLDGTGSCLACEWGCDDNGCYDPCQGVTCDTPPDDYCDGDTAIVYELDGECIGGDCTYTYSEIYCEHGCVDGECRECSSGACCSPDGFILASDTRCGVEPMTAEYGCSEDACGNDALTHEQYQYCNGVEPTCGEDNLVWEDWRIKQSCYTYGYCETDGSDAWCVNCDIGCAEGVCNTELPVNPVDIASNLSPSISPSLLDTVSFLFSGPDAIQKGVSLDTIEEKRIVILNGRVQDVLGAPLLRFPSNDTAQFIEDGIDTHGVFY